MVNSPKPIDYLTLTFIVIVLSLKFLANEFALGSFGPLSLTAGRSALALLILYGYARYKGEKMPRDWATWKSLTFIGLVAMGPFILIPWSQLTLDSHQTAVGIAIMPLTTMVLAHLMTSDEKITRRKAIGLGIGFAGVVVLVGGIPPEDLATDGPPLLLVFLAAILSSYVFVLLKKLPRLSPLVITIGLFTVPTALLIAAAVIFDPTQQESITWQAVAAAVFLAVVVSALTQVMVVALIKKTGATFPSIKGYLVPIFAVIWGALLLHEDVGWNVWAAIALILGGIWIANVSPNQKLHPRFPHHHH